MRGEEKGTLSGTIAISLQDRLRFSLFRSSGAGYHSRGRAPARDHPKMADLPTGTVTLLFTDIEGSTRL